MNRIILIILLLFVSAEADSDQNKDIYKQPYISSLQEHLYKKFDYFADIESMECDYEFRSTICHFNAKHDSHFLSIISILFVAFSLIAGSIGGTSDAAEFNARTHLGIRLSEKKKREIDAQPIYWERAIAIFVIALFLIKFIRADDNSRILNFKNHTLTLENRDYEVVQKYSLKEVKNIEILKYADEDYTHHELNLQLENERINLYASKDDLNINLFAMQLRKKLDRPIVKISTEQ